MIYAFFSYTRLRSLGEHVAESLEGLAGAGVPSAGTGEKGTASLSDYEAIVKHIEQREHEEPAWLAAKLKRVFKLELYPFQRHALSFMLAQASWQLLF